MCNKNRVIITSALFSIIIITAFFVRSVLPLSWSANTKPLTSYLYFDGYPSMMQARDGITWLVWTRSANGYNALFYKTSPNMGYSWSPTMNLTNVPDVYENNKPAITQTSNGVIWVVWTSNRPPPSPPPKPNFSMSASPDSLIIPQNSIGTSTITVKSLNGFNDAVDLDVSGMPQSVEATLNPSQVTPPPNSNANSTLTVTVGASAEPGVYTLTVTGTSTGLIPIEREVDVVLQVVPMDSLGNSIQTFSTTAELEGEIDAYDYEIHCRTSSTNGATWSNIVQLTSNAVDDSAPTILQLRNDTIFVFWQSFVGTNHEIFYQYSSDEGANWTTKQLTSNTDTDSYPSAIQTDNGNIWVVWDSERNGNYDIYYNIYDGSNWLGETRLTTSSLVDTCPSLVETVDGLKYVFWTRCDETPDSKDDIYYSYTSDNGASWSAPIQFTYTDTINDSWPFAVQMRETSVWVVWASDETGDYEIYYKTSLVGDLTGPENPQGSGSYPPDGLVNSYDLVFMRKAYGSKQGDPEWTQYNIADITGPENPSNSRKYPPDNIVSSYDLFALGKNYGKSV